MKKEALNKEKFLKIIEKFLDNECTKEEEALIINFYESFQNDQEWHEEYGIEKEVKEIIHLRILSSISESELPQRKTRKLKLIWKYTAAASIAVLLATSLFFNFKNETLKKQPISVKNDIKIGTDKATLTLDDGGTIALEKGSGFKTTNAESNGEKIVYKKSEEIATPKIAYNYLTIPRGGQFFLELADGTKVWLNSETKIKYPIAFNEGEPRKVELLYGEAYFEVSPSAKHNGDSFIVNLLEQEIEVLGTEFNVNAYLDDKDIRTTLVEGKIALKTDAVNEILLPSQQSVYNKSSKKVALKEINPFYETSWRHGEFNFNNKSLDEVMTVLSRWYDIKIEIQNKENQKFKYIGTLGKHQNIEIILLTLKYTNNLKYEITKDKIIIK